MHGCLVYNFCKWSSSRPIRRRIKCTKVTNKGRKKLGWMWYSNQLRKTYIDYQFSCGSVGLCGRLDSPNSWWIDSFTLLGDVLDLGEKLRVEVRCAQHTRQPSQIGFLLVGDNYRLTSSFRIFLDWFDKRRGRQRGAFEAPWKRRTWREIDG